jgi:hypothetical protein
VSAANERTKKKTHLRDEYETHEFLEVQGMSLVANARQKSTHRMIESLIKASGSRDARVSLDAKDEFGSKSKIKRINSPKRRVRDTRVS